MLHSFSADVLYIFVLALNWIYCDICLYWIKRRGFYCYIETKKSDRVSNIFINFNIAFLVYLITYIFFVLTSDIATTWSSEKKNRTDFQRRFKKWSVPPNKIRKNFSKRKWKKTPKKPHVRLNKRRIWNNYWKCHRKSTYTSTFTSTGKWKARNTLLYLSLYFDSFEICHDKGIFFFVIG